MATRSTDFSGAIVADLPRGRIETRDQRRLVALPADWLSTLVTHASAEALHTLGITLSEALWTDVRGVLEADPEPTIHEVAYALSAALAARGLGIVAFERWGDALVLIWRDPPARNGAWSDLAAATAAALVRRVSGLDVSAAAVDHNGNELRILLASPAVCDLAREQARRGDGFLQILSRLERNAEGA